MQSQLRHGFENLKEEVKNDLIGNPAIFNANLSRHTSEHGF